MADVNNVGLGIYGNITKTHHVLDMFNTGHGWLADVKRLDILIGLNIKQKIGEHFVIKETFLKISYDSGTSVSIDF